MSKLTGLEIAYQVAIGNIIIDPYDARQLNPNSYNVRLGDTLKYLDEVILDLHKAPAVQSIRIPEEGYVINGGVYLGSTIERIGSKRFVPIIDGRSTVGRYGVSVHITAGFGDLGFIGTFTLEIEARHRPTRLRVGDLIAQVSFETVEGDARMLYNGSYQDQVEPREPRPLRG